MRRPEYTARVFPSYGLTIMEISDLHLGGRKIDIAKVVEEVAEEKGVNLADCLILYNDGRFDGYDYEKKQIIPLRMRIPGKAIDEILKLKNESATDAAKRYRGYDKGDSAARVPVSGSIH